MKRIAKLLAAAVAAVTIYCYYALELEDWQVCSARLPAAFDGFRVTLLTDLHGREFGKDNCRLLKAVAQSSPDLIAISGDLADENTDPAVLEPLLTGLTAIAPTCYVTGNHEWARSDTQTLLEQIAACGVTVLRKDYLTLERAGQTIVVAGVDDLLGYDRVDLQTPQKLLERIRAEVPGDPYVVMLSHRNDSMDLWAPLEPDLVLAGHGHGGVIRLPGIGGLLGVDRRFFPDDCEGLYTRGRTTLAVSRGLGWPRLWNLPHLPTVVLRTEAGGS